MKKIYVSRTGNTTATPTTNTQTMANHFAKFIALLFPSLAALMSGMKGSRQTAPSTPWQLPLLVPILH